jgi:hypothetical protein
MPGVRQMERGLVVFLASADAGVVVAIVYFASTYLLMLATMTFEGAPTRNVSSPFLSILTEIVVRNLCTTFLITVPSDLVVAPTYQFGPPCIA